MSGSGWGSCSLGGLAKQMAAGSKDGIMKGTVADFPAAIALWKASVATTHDFVYPEDMARLEAEMPALYLPALNELWLYRKDGELAGICGCNGAYVEMLFVHPNFMRRGIGSKLLENAGKLHGALKLAVNEQNRPALAFYLAQGFDIAGWSSHDNQGRSYPLLHLEQNRGMVLT